MANGITSGLEQQLNRKRRLFTGGQQTSDTQPIIPMFTQRGRDRGMVTPPPSRPQSDFVTNPVGMKSSTVDLDVSTGRTLGSIFGMAGRGIGTAFDVAKANEKLAALNQPKSIKTGPAVAAALTFDLAGSSPNEQLNRTIEQMFGKQRVSRPVPSKIGKPPVKMTKPRPTFKTTKPKATPVKPTKARPTSRPDRGRTPGGQAGRAAARSRNLGKRAG